jgi:D-alanyl-D-alanine dipeptidase
MQNNLLSHDILTYEDLVKVQSVENGEPLVDAKKYDSSIIALYDKTDMHLYTQDIILVRDSLAKKTANVNKQLNDQSGFKLKIVYGYRHPEVQERYFNKRKAEIKKQNPLLDDASLERLTHNFVAISDVAGHPSGGAVDVTIVDADEVALDMGTYIADYADPAKILTFASSITARQKANRQLLHDLMVAEGFAPFYGEWWHFSFGDREWAAFYNKKNALYSTIDFRLNN